MNQSIVSPAPTGPRIAGIQRGLSAVFTSAPSRCHTSDIVQSDVVSKLSFCIPILLSDMHNVRFLLLLKKESPSVLTKLSWIFFLLNLSTYEMLHLMLFTLTSIVVSLISLSFPYHSPPNDFPVELGLGEG